jgi:hypothetical protein
MGYQTTFSQVVISQYLEPGDIRQMLYHLRDMLPPQTNTGSIG